MFFNNIFKLFINLYMSKLKKFLHNNFQFILCIILLIIIFVIAFNPTNYIAETFRGLSVWATIVLPSLFCFFILTKILMQQEKNIKLFCFLDKPFKKLYNVNFGGYIFTMSAISGYPIGVKLISEFYDQNLISKDEAFRLTSFCSTSGPMFIIGSVAVKMFNNYYIGIIILISHLLSSLINGLLYKNVGNKRIPKNNDNIVIKKSTLNDIMLNTITSVLMIGGYIAIAFTLLEFVTNSQFFTQICNFFNNFFNFQIFESIFRGIIEVTSGCVNLVGKVISPKILCVVLTGLISFGGISIHLQSQMFLNKIGIKYKKFLLIKTTQAFISIGLSLVLSLILL